MALDILRDRILRDGKCLKGGILKVDMFVNHLIDPMLMQQIAVEFMRRFSDLKVNKVLTIEASGIAIATMLGHLYDVPVVFAKKSETANSIDDKYVSQAYSFTHKRMNSVFVSKPYLHSIFFSPDRRWMWCNDLGTDMIHSFPLDADGTPCLDDALAASHFLRPGLGPRHCCFAADGQTAYVLGELSDEVCTLRYLPDGSIRIYQVAHADSLQAGGSADIHLSRDGRFLYASHRLKGDGISVFRVRPDGLLDRIAYQPTGEHPRHFALSPDERFLLVGCAYSDEVQVFRRDARTGLLSDTGLRIKTPRPVCLVFVEKP